LKPVTAALSTWLLALVAIVVAAILGLAIAPPGPADGGSMFGRLLDATVLAPGMVIPTAIGGVLYTLAVAVGRRRGVLRRGLAIVLTPLVVVPWFALPIWHLLQIPGLVAGIAIGAIVLGLAAAQIWNATSSA
jgi:hypothetical protein